ncbi:helix-turn-helix domain-containing protein [Streptomyces sp. NPDC127066]|uniref:helix-turn-helix domain-containing protein n=1 Tax=Streptomyces sp. NPDC127066 TaxID=3347125 RepID=UPI00365BCE20
MGQDGRVRPLNVDEGRRRAAQLMAEYPGASLREIAREAGISPATVSDVRKRVQAGRPPVPAQSPSRADGTEEPKVGRPDRRVALSKELTPVPGGGVELSEPDLVPSSLMLEKLRRDPSLRLREDGRGLLRLLQYNALVGWPELGAVVPRHWEVLVSRLARENAARWLEFAQRLEGRMAAVPQRRVHQEQDDVQI